MPSVDNIPEPKNSPPFAPERYGKLRSQFMAPPLRWSNARFKEVFGTNAKGSVHENVAKVVSAYESI